MAKTRETFALDLTGQKFGRWTIKRKHEGKTKLGAIFWVCECDCGSVKKVLAQTLRNGRSKSCGCYSRERTRTHGMEGTRVYDCWAHMLDRCRNPRNRFYKDYGGRGIKVCERWRKFENFYSDMGDMPEGKGIDRWPNNDGNYEPGNCRWADVRQQIRNRRVTRMIEYRGTKVPLAELAESHGLKARLVRERMNRGLSIEEALSLVRGGRWGATKTSIRD